MSEVNSKTIRAYARSLKSISISLDIDLKQLGFTDINKTSVGIESLADEVLLIAKKLALTEFEKEWGKC